MNGATQSNMLVQLIPFVVIFVIFYLLIIMPARKKQKQHQNMINSLKGGERDHHRRRHLRHRLPRHGRPLRDPGGRQYQAADHQILHFHGPGNGRRQEQVIPSQPAAFGLESGEIFLQMRQLG